MKRLLTILLLFGIFGCAVEKTKKVAYVAFNTEGTYEGQWKYGQPNGQGTWTNAKEYSYVGEWKDGQPNGQGTYTFSDGDTYVGEWKDGKEHGQGTYTSIGFLYEKKYVGEWKEGKRHGQGTYTAPLTPEKYVGEWKDGKEHGQGTRTFKGNTYVGEFKKGSRDGQGTMYFSDGGIYVGEFKEGTRDGQGTYTFSDGDTYVGEWKDGKEHGQGTMTYANGFTKVGEFKDGEYVGPSEELMTWLNAPIQSEDSIYNGKIVRCDVEGLKTVYFIKDNLLNVVTSMQTQHTQTIVSSTKTSATYDTRNNILGKITIDFAKNTYTDNFGTIKCEGGYLKS